MVNLPVQEAVQERRRRGPRNHHMWGVNLTPQEREEARHPPRTLGDFKKRAERALKRMARHVPPDEEVVVALLLKQYELVSEQIF